jgi:uncharacterized protein (TIGR00725 family)
MDYQKIIAVIGAARASEKELAMAEEVGRDLAASGAVLLCGGLGGVMEAACRGSKSRGGLSIGILPGENRSSANNFVDIAVVTGMGKARNFIIAKSARAVIAVGGSYGTLSEISYALQNGIPVIGLATWKIYQGGKKDRSIIYVRTPSQAVSLALEMMDD